MEHEIKFDENTRKLIKAFRAKVSNGQHATRETLLAYAFLRGRPYIALEKRINEEHESFGEGTKNFLASLSCSVAHEIGINKDPDFRVFNNPVLSWINEKYKTEETKTEEKAA
jgi:hypothetical protein